MFPDISADAVALQADGTAVADVPQRAQKTRKVVVPFGERLNVAAPARLGIEFMLQ